MLKWIGLEESLFELENQSEYLEIFVKHVELAGIKVISHSNKDVDFFKNMPRLEGLIILNGTETHLQDLIGKMPVIGFDARSGFHKEQLSEQHAFMESGCSMPEGIRYVIESFQGIDIEYLQMVYNRFYDIPVIIARNYREVLREITLEDVPVLWEAGISIRNMDGNVDEDMSLEKEMEFVKAYISNMYHFYNYGMWILCKPDKKDVELQECPKKERNGQLCNQREDEVILGIAGFDHIDPEDLPEKSLARQEVENKFCLQAGYHISYNYRQQRYGHEALQVIVKYGFEHIGVDEIMLFIEPQNTPSKKLAGKAGFTYLENTFYQGKEIEVYITV